MVGLHWHRRVLWADNASPTHASFQIGVNPAPNPEFANRIAEISNAPRVEQVTVVSQITRYEACTQKNGDLLKSCGYVARLI
jgi:hypothetical protein